MRGIRRATLALVTVGLTMSAGAAFTGKSASKAATAQHASLKAPKQLSPTDRCESLDAGLDVAIARGPQTGPGHDALVNAERRALQAAGCPAERAVPTLTTTTPATVPVNSPIHDVAHLAGGSNPTGQIGFTLFSRPDCLGPSVFTDTVVNVAGAGDYSSANFTPTTPGDYSWAAFYTGDANNTSATSACEPFTVTPAG